MKYIIFSFLLALPFIGLSQDQLFFGRGNFSFTVDSDSSAVGFITDFVDQTSSSFKLDSLEKGFVLVSSNGSFWKTDTVYSKSRFSAQIRAVNLSDFGSKPTGYGNVSETNECGQIPASAMNSIGISAAAQAEISRYNVQKQKECIPNVPELEVDKGLGNGFTFVTNIDLSEFIGANQDVINSKLIVKRGGIEIDYPSRYIILNDSTIRVELDPLAGELVKIQKN